MHDDRAEFAKQQRTLAAHLAADTEVVHRANALTIDLVPHRYTYMWSWLGVPIIQLPVDIVVLQETIWEARPTVIIETGVARGGSLILYASILQLLGDGRVIGVDNDIRPHNRETIEQHPLAHRISLVEGSSVEATTLARVQAMIPANARVMVVLDSDHTHEHVLAELRAYASLVTPEQFLVVADTGLGMPEAANLKLDRWQPNSNPLTALHAFLNETDHFAPDPYYNGKLLISSSPGGYLRCLRNT